MEKLTKKERLFDLTQLAKSIFIIKAGEHDFSNGSSYERLVDISFLAANEFLSKQEKIAEGTKDGI